MEAEKKQKAIDAATKIIKEATEGFNKLAVAYLEVSTRLNDMEKSYNKLLEQVKQKDKLSK